MANSSSTRFPGDQRLHFERAVLVAYSGLPPIAARMIAYMLMADEDLVSGQQMGADLGISAASLSTMTRLLVGQSCFERVKVTGVRGDFYRCVVDARALIKALVDSLRLVTELSAAAPDNLSPGARKRIAAHVGTAAVLLERLEPLSRISHVSGSRRRRTS